MWPIPRSDGLEGYDLGPRRRPTTSSYRRSHAAEDGRSVPDRRACARKRSTTPILILSALGQVDDRVKGLAGGGRRLPSQTLCLFRTARPRRGARAAQDSQATARKPTYRVGTPRTRSPRAQADARRKGDRAAAPRIPAARISHETQRPGRDPHDAARKCLGLSLRPSDQRDRRAYLAACARRSTRASIMPLLHTVRGAGYSIRDGTARDSASRDSAGRDSAR